METHKIQQIVLLCLLTLLVGCNAQCSNTTTTIRGIADTAPLSACKTFTGVIAVATDSDPVIELNGVQKIEGDFIAADNSQVTTFGSDSLEVATGKVEFSNLPVLANISLPKWESTGKLVMDRIPSPTYTNFQQKGQQISEIYVRNTTFAFFSGLTLIGAQIEVLEIVDNAYLQIISFLAGNITKSATITGNGGDLELQLPNLTYSYSLIVSNASKIDLPMLSSVSNGLDISYSSASEVSIPQLTYVGGDLKVSDNQHLSKLEMKELVNIQGDLDIMDNKALHDLDGLPYLSSIGDDLTLTGAFDSVSLPSLGIVRNDIAITSTGSVNCSDISPSLAKGSYSCKGNAASANPGDNADKKSGKDSLSAGAKAGIAIGTIAVVAILAILGFLIWKWRRHHSPQNREKSKEQAPRSYLESRIDEVPADKKDNYEMEYYSVEAGLDNSSQKELVQRESEMGRPSMGSHPGPEGRHEMYNIRDAPAAHELPGGDTHELSGGDIDKESR